MNRIPLILAAHLMVIAPTYGLNEGNNYDVSIVFRDRRRDARAATGGERLLDAELKRMRRAARRLRDREAGAGVGVLDA